uniref:MaoC-like domain-containing protein n=1 Tax=Plectus sambesii TaxID=2011161 RepID=A0A914WX11_9BILA
MDVALAKKFDFQPTFYKYSAKEAIFYALGVGTESSGSGLRFVYEKDANFSVLPTFAVVPGFHVINKLDSVPGLKWDWSKILHGEQFLQVLRPFPTEATLRSQGQIADILDKGKGALILINVDTFNDETNEKLSHAQYSIFEVGAGGFNGERTSTEERQVESVPTRQPDTVVEQGIAANQAALYRHASGDLNPLHVDPKFAAKFGFSQPILHGLCTLGFAVRHVLHQYANDDVSKFVAVKVRFSKPVTPGQTLITEMWKEDARIHFQTKLKEDGTVVLGSGYVDLVDPVAIVRDSISDVKITA